MSVVALHTEPAPAHSANSQLPSRKTIPPGQLLIRLANDTDYGLASGIQTSDLGRALRLADRIKAGTVWLNTWHKHRPNAPFGGYKASGYGRQRGAEALENYTQYNTVWANLG